jgi:UDP-2,4-diacetamido-2,4,6-trideoxy-beta-L-altropyranose hydrolase
VRESTENQIGIIVDAGPSLGYGRVLRCLRLAGEVQAFARITFYPLSEACAQFLWAASPEFDVRPPQSSLTCDTVITDVAEPSLLRAMIRNQGSRHISIHDVGLGQCDSDVVVDSSVAPLVPFTQNRNQELFLGPAYAITRTPVVRMPEENRVLVTLGGGLSAGLGPQIQARLRPLGLKVFVTHGFDSASPTTNREIENAMSTCRFAIAIAGTSLYDLLASGVPTIALAIGPEQLRTANAFHERRAALSAGLVNRLTTDALIARARQIMDNISETERMVRIGRNLVDGEGLNRVTRIVRQAVNTKREEVLVNS